ncbi:putative amidohydrolase [Croceifilum oryzae]|uniref:Amidohydrolase n=1 Tax=Croceifilum oryzae TaxID=1553429 RepID=A0AAJ1WTB4_9BACL|nr:carbon-nitrogen family hydrolase [Croceifilum oryzae]MDQ0416831.1 putative amidohydrolase [Croceifilum oryzae]
MKQTICLIQMDITFGDPEANMKRVKDLMHQVMKQLNPPHVIVLPELWTTGYDLERLHEISDPDGECTRSLFTQLAKKYQVHIVAGSIPKKTEAGITNTLYAFNREGEIVNEYNKAHLIQLMDEHLYLTAGSRIEPFMLDDVVSAGFICYDLRFPEWIRKAILAGAEVLYIPAQWPIQRLSHWRSLCIARAIENQCYVIACNRTGSDPNNQFAGHSMVIDPWGEILAEADEKAAIIQVEIDTDQVKKIRSTIPIFTDRRPEIY